MKLTKAQSYALELSLRELQRAAEFLDNPDIYVCAAVDNATHALVFSRPFKSEEGDRIIGAPKAKHLATVNKEYGSNLTGLHTAISDLKKFLQYNTTQQSKTRH